MAGLLSQVKKTAEVMPPRTFLYAREKWGKSSMFTHDPHSIYFMTRGETGLLELLAGGRVPDTAHFPYDEQKPPTWSLLRSAVRELRDSDHSYKHFVLDTSNGAEILCQEHVRSSQFGGDHKKFASYGKGWESCRIEWLGLLTDLDAMRAKRKMAVTFLAHTQIKKFEDPTTEDSYDKFKPSCQEKLWDLTHKWADIICFGHFQAETYETDSGKTKAKSELTRVICFEQSPLWEAGNRYGISGAITVNNGADAAYKTFTAAVTKARENRPSDAQVESRLRQASSMDALRGEWDSLSPDQQRRLKPLLDQLKKQFPTTNPTPSQPASQPVTTSPAAAKSSVDLPAVFNPPYDDEDSDEYSLDDSRDDSEPEPQEPEPVQQSVQHMVKLDVIPVPGDDFADWVNGHDEGFADSGLTSPGAIKAHVLEVGSRKGCNADWTRWNASAIQLAVQSLAALEIALLRPELAAVKAELVRTKKKWSECVTWLNSHFDTRYTPQTKLWELTTKQLDSLAKNLATHKVGIPASTTQSPTAEFA